MFVKAPGFTAIAVLSIAFGTGANVAIFSVTDAMLLRPLPILKPADLLTVGSEVKRGFALMHVASYLDYVDVRRESRAFSALAAYDYELVGIATKLGEPPRVRYATIVSSNFFDVLGVPPEVGRGFLPEEEAPSAPQPVAVLSYTYWQTEFAGDPHVLGRTLRIAGIDFSIVGVAPERFTGMHPVVRDSVFVPISMWPKILDGPRPNPTTNRHVRWLRVRGRLAPGMTLATAQAELDTISASLERSYPATNKGFGLTVDTEFAVRIEERPLDGAMAILLNLLSVAVLCVACANVAGLLTSRAPVRAREISLRLALGASRTRLVRQLITESVLIALAGGAAGLLVGWIGISTLRQIQFPSDIVSVPAMHMDGRTLTFSLIVSMASAFLFGLGPAIHTTRVDLAAAMKAGDASPNRRLRLSTRNFLVGLQVALSLVVMTIAGFAVQAFSHEIVAGPGFRTSRMAKVTIDPGQARYDDRATLRFFEQILTSARALPGVESASITSAMPFFSFNVAPLLPEGFQLPEGQASMPAVSNSVDETYFDTMQIPIVVGRAFRTTDTAKSTRVAIVNETLARHYWGGAGSSLVESLGKRFHLAGDNGDWIEVVGVAKTTQYWFPGEQAQDAVYFPFRQKLDANMTLLAATAGQSADLVAPLRAVSTDIDPDVPAFDAQTMEAFYAARVLSFGVVMIRLVGGMGVMGMVLTAVGLYGLVSYAVSRRTREIGIRMAIGATDRRVVGMVMRQGMSPAVVGLLFGFVGSWATAKLLPGIAPVSLHYDAGVLWLIAPIMVVVTLVAAFVPARRAARINPTVALRYE